jgi:trimethylamine--corrinoid protein Co-methyltransferase
MNQRHKKKRFQYKPLRKEDIQQIHDTSMRVLEEVGFEVQQEEAFSLFQKAGAVVDEETRIVKLKEEQVNKIISTVPEQVTLYGKEDRYNLTLGAGNSYFGTGGTALYILDYETGERRKAELHDLIDVIHLVNHLDNIDFMLLPTYPNEIPVEEVDINRFYAGLQYSKKPIMGGIYTPEGIDRCIEMAELIAGGNQALRERPTISMIACGISPLRLDEMYGGFMIKLARHGIPTAVPVEPLCGATAPVTLAGTLVIQNCDGLISVMITQLANPGAPVIYGSVATSVNMHDIGYLGGPVESGMINAATAQLARFYSFPYYSTAGISDSKTLDAQCGYEATVNNMLVGMAGGDFIHDAAGLMEFAMTVSKEKLVLDNEIIGMVKRVVNGIEVNEKTLAFDTIKNIGPGGNFVAARHTRKFYHKEHYHPQLTNRDNRDTWKANGSHPIDKQANDVVNTILNTKPVCHIEDQLTQDIRDRFPEIR